MTEPSLSKNYKEINPSSDTPDITPPPRVSYRRQAIHAALGMLLNWGPIILDEIVRENAPNDSEVTAMTDKLAEGFSGATDEIKKTVEEILEELEDIANGNAEVIAAIESKRSRSIDRGIDRYMDPNSSEYLGSLDTMPIPPASAFFEIDAYKRAIEIAHKWDGEEPLDAVHLEQIRTEQYDYLEEQYQAKLQVILNQAETQWTGDIFEDIPTLQKALFLGEDRFFHHPGYEKTKYQMDYKDFDIQMENGIVNCQVSRMTGFFLADIYKGKDITEHDLSSLRTLDWTDHVASALAITDENGEITYYAVREEILAQEGKEAMTITEGLQPGKAENPGLALPISYHLAYYYLHHGASSKQRQRMVELGIIDPSSQEHSEGGPTEAIVDFNHYEQAIEENDPRFKDPEFVRENNVLEGDKELPPKVERSEGEGGSGTGVGEGTGPQVSVNSNSPAAELPKWRTARSGAEADRHVNHQLDLIMRHFLNESPLGDSSGFSNSNNGSGTQMYFRTHPERLNDPRFRQLFYSELEGVGTLHLTDETYRKLILFLPQSELDMMAQDKADEFLALAAEDKSFIRKLQRLESNFARNVLLKMTEDERFLAYSLSEIENRITKVSQKPNWTELQKLKDVFGYHDFLQQIQGFDLELSENEVQSIETFIITLESQRNNGFSTADHYSMEELKNVPYQELHDVFNRSVMVRDNILIGSERQSTDASERIVRQVFLERAMDNSPEAALEFYKNIFEAQFTDNTAQDPGISEARTFTLQVDFIQAGLVLNNWIESGQVPPELQAEFIAIFEKALMTSFQKRISGEQDEDLLDEVVPVIPHLPQLEPSFVKAFQRMRISAFDIAYYELDRYGLERTLPETFTLREVYDSTRERTDFEDTSREARKELRFLGNLQNQTYNYDSPEFRAQFAKAYQEEPKQAMRKLRALGIPTLSRANRPFLAKEDLLAVDLASLRATPWSRYEGNMSAIPWGTKELYPQLVSRLFYDADSLTSNDYYHLTNQAAGNWAYRQDRALSLFAPDKFLELYFEMKGIEDPRKKAEGDLSN
jgi:hypothetical protein